jgi:hypothetical protein
MGDADWRFWRQYSAASLALRPEELELAIGVGGALDDRSGWALDGGGGGGRKNGGVRDGLSGPAYFNLPPILCGVQHGHRCQRSGAKPGSAA